MIDIDFLPAQYHERNAYRQAKPWQIIVVASFLGLVALLTISQNIRRQLVEKELDALAPAYELALSQKQRLSEVQGQLKQSDSRAELITYLRHPWPRSQLLSALLSKLPEEITLQQLQITRELEIANPASDHAAPAAAPNADQQKALSPTERDLQSLQGQAEGRQTVVVLIGTTTDSSALHHYLDEMQSNTLFSKAEPGSVSSAGEPSSAEIEFHAKLVVRPGYGEPGSLMDEPKTPPEQSSPKTNSAPGGTRAGSTPESRENKVKYTIITDRRG